MKPIRLLLAPLLLSFIFSFTALAKSSDHPLKTQKQKIFKPLWSQSLKSGGSKKRYFPEDTTALVEGGRLYVGTHSSLFYCLDLNAGGKVLWKFESSGPIATQAVKGPDSVYFGNNEGDIYSLEAATGRVNWTAYLGGEILGQPALVGSRLYVVTTSREVYALDALTGQEIWNSYVKGFEKKFTMRGNASVVAMEDRLYIGFADGQLVSLSSASGEVVWSKTFGLYETAFKDLDATVVADSGALYVVGYFGGLLKISMADGRILWKKENRSGNTIAQNADSIFVSGTNSHLVGYDKQTGNRIWDAPINSGALSPPVVVENYVLVGSQKNGLYVFDAASGKALQNLPLSSGSLTKPQVDNNMAYVVSSSARVTALKASLK